MVIQSLMFHKDYFTKKLAEIGLEDMNLSQLKNCMKHYLIIEHD